MGVKLAWMALDGHVCPKETPEQIGNNRGGTSATQIQTQDGRWLYDREIPEVV
jgi:hypothetical protein